MNELLRNKNNKLSITILVNIFFPLPHGNNYKSAPTICTILEYYEQLVSLVASVFSDVTMSDLQNQNFGRRCGVEVFHDIRSDN